MAASPIGSRWRLVLGTVGRREHPPNTRPDRDYDGREARCSASHCSLIQPKWAAGNAPGSRAFSITVAAKVMRTPRIASICAPRRRDLRRQRITIIEGLSVQWVPRARRLPRSELIVVRPSGGRDPCDRPAQPGWIPDLWRTTPVTAEQKRSASNSQRSFSSKLAATSHTSLGVPEPAFSH